MNPLSSAMNAKSSIPGRLERRLSLLAESSMTSTAGTDIQPRMKNARDKLDAWVREIVEWHFNPETGCPFWLDYAQKLDWDPRIEIRGYSDLSRFGFFQDDWLRGGPVRRW